MAKLRKASEASIITIFGAWLVATLLSQHPESSLERVRRLDDRFGNTVIPNWKFFAPNPAVEDVHILYRFASEDFSQHSQWMECHTISPRKLSQIFWFPRRRFEKAVFDAHQSLTVGLASMGRDELSDGILRQSIKDTAEMLNNHIRLISKPDNKWFWQQLMLVRFAGNDDSAEPIYDLILNYEVINEDLPIAVSPIFECDEYFDEHYDQVLMHLDPNADHVDWIVSSVKTESPKRVLDVGAGTGRVLSELSERFPTAEFFAIEPNERFCEKLRQINVAVVPMEVEEVVYKQQISGVDLAYSTYGALQYVSTKEELVDHLRSVGELMNKGGVLLVEMFSSEIYHSLIQSSDSYLWLEDEKHIVSFSTLRYPNGLVEATTSLRREHDGETGIMHEVILPISRGEAESSLREAGFSLIRAELKGAYHRCTAFKL